MQVQPSRAEQALSARISPYMIIEASTCVVCDGSDFRSFWRVLKKCSSCGHVTANLDLKEFDFSQIYCDEYFSGAEYADYLRDRPVFVLQFQDRLREVMAFQKSGDLIEIGCAYGFFLEVAQRFFRVQGFDICSGPLRFAGEQLKLPVHCEDFASAEVPADCADVIVMWDTIEHLPRPDLTLQAAARALRPGGHLFVTTGDVASILARVQRHKWRMVHPPTHLHYFSKRTIRQLLSSTGFDQVAIRYVGTRRSVGQTAFCLCEINRQTPSWLHRLISGSRLARLSFVLNTFDIMLVVARKPGAV